MRTRSTLRRSSALAAMALTASLVLAACGDDDGGDDGNGEEPTAEAGDFPEGSTMAELAEAGEITVGTKFDQPLFGLVGPDGTPVGFDVEIAKIIASELGISEDNIEWVETVSANREPFIQDGRVDIVVATYTINDERKQLVDFAGPYFVAGQTIMVLEENTDINGPDDLAGRRVCSVEGSTPAENIRTNYPEAELFPTGAYSDCLEPLRNGQVDAVTTDNVILSGFVDQNPGEFKLVGEPFTEEPYGIGLMHGDTEFRNWINDVLEASFEDGRWEEAWAETAGAVLETPEPPQVDRY
ncbi:glutamate ABC transporter substrate-binding protein [Jiangella aurantiaca]|uniref:Glutamate ABC transporter substrate-binding protein n=1 Tax=Jiangella aurantiaca TaxID=2530373 RepID=A0A4V2YSA1_9ACTN|nr:glutamate ABC transporter substrate-binding protein [Jiangella aurantiaca]TDD68767.1 glutamate ABC transporter substrate-binding protein [Jiangella aurantiaca]